jgi:ribose 5-phosphate isomerase A
MLSSNEIKQRVALHATRLVQPGMTIGLGSGTTMYWFVMALAGQIKEGLEFSAVPTSFEVHKLAQEKGISIKTLNQVDSIDLTVDGADEIDPNWQLIKGGGAALLQEKMVAAASRKLTIIADHTKMVKQLGRFPLPVEVIPYGWKQVQRKVEQFYKIHTTLRERNDQPLVTDHGHYILDCHFGQITDAPVLNAELHLIPGVVETGLFIDMVSGIYIGNSDGRIEEFKKL